MLDDQENVSHGVRKNEEICDFMKQPNLVEKQENKRLQWLEYLARMAPVIISPKRHYCDTWSNETISMLQHAIVR